MINFIPIKPSSFGVEISDSCLRIVSLKKRGRFFKLVSFGKFKIPPRIVENGEIKLQKKLAKVIEKSLIEVNGEKLKAKDIVFSLPEEKVFLKVIKMPKMTVEELREATVFEVENYIPISVEDVYLDFTILDQGVLDQKILIAASPKKVVKNYLSLFEKCGLRPQAFETESTALCRALIKENKIEKPLLIVDLKDSKTNFIIFSKRSAIFSSSIPLSFEKDPKKIIEKAKNCIEYYKSRYSSEGKLNKILLSGHIIAPKKIVKEFSELGIKTELSNPLINIMPSKKGKFSEIPSRELLEYGVCLGLALRNFYQ